MLQIISLHADRAPNTIAWSVSVMLYVWVWRYSRWHRVWLFALVLFFLINRACTEGAWHISYHYYPGTEQRDYTLIFSLKDCVEKHCTKPNRYTANILCRHLNPIDALVSSLWGAFKSFIKCCHNVLFIWQSTYRINGRYWTSQKSSNFKTMYIHGVLPALNARTCTAHKHSEGAVPISI